MAVPGRPPVFTFESSVHPAHVLRSLEDQRQRDFLCDVTVVTTEGQSFRAHRSVLASCSEYFSQRLSSLSRQNTVLTLPPEVTPAGFEPLLKFAYTSKLLFCREDVLDIQTSVSVLGFKDFDGACFDFLLPKFFPSTKACVLRKACCKNKCEKELSRDTSDDERLLLAKPVADSPSREEVAFECNTPDTDTTEKAVRSSTPTIPATPAECLTPATPLMPVSEVATNDNMVQCPKYRKFQMAWGKESHQSRPMTVNKYCCDSPCSSNSESCPLRVSRQVEDLFYGELGDFHRVDASKADRLFEKKHGTEMQGNRCSVKKSARGESDGLTGLGSPECTSKAQQGAESPGRNSFAQRKCAEAREETMCKDRLVAKEVQNCNEKWTVEDENTAKVSLDWLNVQLDIRSSLLPDVDHSASGWKCPKSSECEVASQSGLSSLNSGEDSDTEEAEGYCDAYVQERAKQMQLPFAVDRMLEMSRNEFQELLDKQNLTQEQVELLRDMRRRSKNRLAAKRCRKRKLDCIYNLQCEINKLKTEREKLIQEKSRLSQLRLKTCHSVSTLCQSLCVGANLPPEQLQLLNKYSSAECPLASFNPIIDSLLSPSQHPRTQRAPPGGRQEHLPKHSVTM